MPVNERQRLAIASWSRIFCSKTYLVQTMSSMQQFSYGLQFTKIWRTCVPICYKHCSMNYDSSKWYCDCAYLKCIRTSNKKERPQENYRLQCSSTQNFTGKLFLYLPRGMKFSLEFQFCIWILKKFSSANYSIFYKCLNDREFKIQNLLIFDSVNTTILGRFTKFKSMYIFIP